MILPVLVISVDVPRKFNFSSSSSTSTDNSPRHNIRAVSTVPDSEFAVMDEEKESNEPSAVDFAFVHMVLRSLDVHFRRACGGQKLRDTVLDNNITLSCMDHIPLLNCAGGTCGTCLDLVEVKLAARLLGSRTDKEKEKLKMVFFFFYLTITHHSAFLLSGMRLSGLTEKQILL
ncbi:hypothetical protein GQ457_09G006550 [Hibiscus cannabinus]